MGMRFIFNEPNTVAVSNIGVVGFESQWSHGCLCVYYDLCCPACR
jgi:hypothetical protein